MSDLFKTANIALKSGPDWTAEERLIKEYKWDQNAFICGVDEVGRGPLAGPVIACAVILNPDNIPEGLNDSKKLSAKKRAILNDEIKLHARAISLGEASVAEIEDINILQASMLAMRRAVSGLKLVPVAALVDGNRDPIFTKPDGLICETLVKGDARSLSIAAASIIAKQYRDQLMSDYAKDYPQYGWDRNAGYGVKAHLEALNRVGISPHHRKTFAPIAKLLPK